MNQKEHCTRYFISDTSASLQKRQRDSTREDNEEFVDVLKAVGEVGKGFVRSIRFLKAPKLIN